MRHFKDPSGSDILNVLLIVTHMPQQAGTYCEMCCMPFSKDTGTRENDTYCSLCFKNGRLNYQGDDLKEFQRMALESMRARGINPLKARFFAYMIKFAPHWRKKK